MQHERDLTTPSDFRRTFRMIPKDPVPIMSRGSYRLRKDDMVRRRRGEARRSSSTLLVQGGRQTPELAPMLSRDVSCDRVHWRSIWGKSRPDWTMRGEGSADKANGNEASHFQSMFFLAKMWA